MNILRIDGRQLQLFNYVLLTCILTYFIGTRGLDIGSDTPTYYRYFNFIKFGDYFEGVNRIEIGFYWLTKAIASFTDSEAVYLSIIFLIQFIGITSALNKKSEIFKPYLLIALVWLSFPFFYSITLNVLRQGLAFVFVVYSIDAKLQNKKYSPYILLLLGTLFHYVTIIYVACYIVLEFKPKPIVLLYLWFGAVASSFLGITVRFTRPILEYVFGYTPHYSNYLDVCMNLNSFVGFRLDFVIFSSLPVVYFLFLKKYYGEHKLESQFVFSLYFALNIIYLIFADFPYNDRIAMTSWLLMPLMVDFNFLRRIKILGLFTVSILCSGIFVFSYNLFF